MTKIILLTAFALIITATPALSRTKKDSFISRSREATGTKVDSSGESYNAIVKQYGFEGEYLVGKGDRIVGEDNILFPQFVQSGRNSPTKPSPASPRSWRWASVTKQIVATLVMQEVAKRMVDLDKPVSTYLPGLKSANAPIMTVRQLLQHQSGLPNPDDTPASKDGIPAYYVNHDPASHNSLTGYCAGQIKGAPGGNWSYNNCDYIVAGALLEAVTNTSWEKLVANRIAKPLGLKSLGAFPTAKPTMAGTVDGKPEGNYRLDTFGAAAGLYGTAKDLWAFDRALMMGKLLPEAQRSVMWDGKPDLGFMGLGQWVFSVPLKGCAAPVRIVERRGAIGGVEVRNFIIPGSDTVVIAFTDRSGFDFGEVWQGKGFSFALLSAAVCPS